MSTNKENDNKIKIIYTLNDEENVINFDPEETFLLFKFFISNNSKVNLEKYEVYYEDKNLNENFEKMKLREIIFNNKFPIFNFKMKPKINDSVILKPKGSKEIYKHVVQLENFPSRPEIFSILENFLANQNLKDGYNYCIEGSILKIHFQSLVKVMIDRKYNNHLYEKLKVYLFIEDFKSKNKFENKEVYDSFLKEQSSILNELRSEKTKYHSVKHKKIKPSLILNNYDPSIQNGSPYVTEAERHRKEYVENRKKWIANDFSGCINSNKFPRYIGNYVNMSPSMSPLHYKFREINKSKWIKGIDFFL